MDYAKLIMDMKELISTPEKWTKGTEARDKNGNICSYSDAVCFCTLGAFEMVVNEQNITGIDRDTIFDYIAATIKKLGYHSITYFNDNHTHEDVMNLFDKAIELSKQ